LIGERATLGALFGLNTITTEGRRQWISASARKIAKKSPTGCPTCSPTRSRSTSRRRIRALGVVAPGSFSEFAKLTVIKESEGSPSATEMIKQLVAGQEAVTKTARSIFPIVDKAGDEPTADLLTQRMQTAT